MPGFLLSGSSGEIAPQPPPETRGEAPFAPGPRTSPESPLSGASSERRSEHVPSGYGSEPSGAPSEKAPGPAPAGDTRPPKRSAIETRTAETLSKMWQWIVVGEEYRKGGTSKEYAVATTWMLRAAMLLLIFGLAYFIKYTHERNLVPPELRLSVAALFTLALLGVGCRLLSGAKYRIFGTALAGAGFAGLYLCVFASVSVYHLLSAWIGLAGLVVVTAAGVALALRFNSILLAVLAVCGGYLAPILMDTGSHNLAGLFAYMLILVVGSLIVARMRSWQPVNILSFLFTWAIYAASKPFPEHTGYGTPLIRQTEYWLLHADEVNRAYAVAIGAGTLFFLAFCVQTVAFNLFTKRKVSLLELGFGALNGIVFMSLAIPPTIGIYGREYAAAVTFGGALVYLLQIALLIRVKLEDRSLLLTLLVFSCGLISLTFPLLLKQDHLAVAWSVQAAAMLYIACRTRSGILLRLSYIVYMVAAVRLLGFDLSRGYWRHSVTFWTRLLNFGSCTAALAGGFFLLKRYGAELTAATASARAGSPPVYSRSAKSMFWCAFAVSFILVAGEFTYLRHLKVGGVVATAAVYLLILSLVPRLFRENARSIRTAAWVLLGIFLCFVGASWQSGGHSVHDSLWRLFPNLLSVAALIFAGLFFGNGIDAGEGGETDGKAVLRKAGGTEVIFILSALVLWFLYSTDETSFLVGLYGSREGAKIAVSLLWGVYALALLAFGILRRKKTVRIPALILFAVTVLKLFIFDLAGTPALYRVAGCMITGVVLVAGAWLYARFAQKGDSSDELRP